MAWLAHCLLEQEKWAEAEVVLRECLAICEKLAPDDWTRFNAMSLLGAALLGRRCYPEAEPLIVGGYEGVKACEAKVPSSSKPFVAVAAARVLRLYEAWGRHDEAARWRRSSEDRPLLRAMDLHRRTPGQPVRAVTVQSEQAEYAPSGQRAGGRRSRPSSWRPADASRDTLPDLRLQLPGRAPSGLCPRCLIRAGLDADALSLAHAGQDGPTTATRAGPPSVLDTLAATLGPVPRVLLRDTEPATGPGPLVQPGSPEMPDAGRPPGRLQLLGEIARGGMGAVLKGRDPTSAATWPSRSCSSATATSPSWSAGSSRRPRSAASSSTRASCRSTSWAPSPTAGRTSP